MKVAVEEKIVQIIKEKFNVEKDISFNESFIESGMIESKQIPELLCSLERIFNINFDREHLDLCRVETPKNLAKEINSIIGLDNLTIRDLFLDICNAHEESFAISFDGEKITYAQLQKKVEILASSFMKRGIAKETLVAIIMSNRMEYLLSYFALFYIGALPVPINTRWKKDELSNVLQNAQPQFIICEEVVGNIRYGQHISEYMETYDHIKKVFYIGENLYGEFGEEFSCLSNTDEIQLAGLEQLEPKAPALISYTSGTTGIPKGVILKHNDLVKISKYTAEIWYDNGECPFSIAPLYAAQGFLGFLIHFSAEKIFKMTSSFSPNDILEEISKREDTSFHTQPTMWNLLLNCRIIDFTRFDKLNLLIISGSLCSAALAKRIEEKLGCVMVNAYGLIEGTSVVTTTRKDDPDDIRYNTVGRPIPGVEIKIVDENRNELPKGEIGELAVRGYNMIGYFHNAQKTAEVIDSEGWLYTGDLAKFYDEENISIVGRNKDMIIRGGFNVYPSDIEEYIMELDKVQSVAVIGKDNEILGEEIEAYIVLKPGMQMEQKEVTKYLFNKIANYKMPDKIYFISEMPIILAGKIDKRVLREWSKKGIPTDKQILFGDV